MQRTNTASLSEIPLSGSEPVVFGFPQRNLVNIKIPAGSTWHVRYHWHDQQVDASRLHVLDGRIIISIVHHVNDAASISEDRTLGAHDPDGISFGLHEATAWKTDRLIQTTVAMTAKADLHRNVCSAQLDRDLFPRLRSTPFCMKGLFATLSWLLPHQRRRLLDLMLWVQLQTIFWEHDYHFDHGCIPFTWPWTTHPFGGKPPQWARHLERQSLRVISRSVMAGSATMGKALLGMQGQYVEYIPRKNADEKLDYSFRHQQTLG